MSQTPEAPEYPGEWKHTPLHPRLPQSTGPLKVQPLDVHRRILRDPQTNAYIAGRTIAVGTDDDIRDNG